MISKPESTIGERLSTGYTSNGGLGTFHNVITALLDKQMNSSDSSPKTLVFSRGAKNYIEQLARYIEGEQAKNCYLSEMTDFAGRYVENICRTAALFHYFSQGVSVIENDGCGEISRETVEGAVFFNSYYLNSVMEIDALKIHSPVRDANALFEWMHDQHEKYGNVFTKTILLQFGPRSLRNKKWLEPAINVLAENNLIVKKWLHDKSGEVPDKLVYRINWEEFNKQRDNWDIYGYIHMTTQYEVGVTRKRMNLDDLAI